MNNPRMMGTAYYAEKLPQYYKGIFETGEWICKPLAYIKKVIANECEKWNVKAICAYNAQFDTRALRNTVRYVTKSDTQEFLPNLDIYCIWHMACQTIANTLKYAQFCKENGFYSQTSAEIVHRYLTDTLDFEESHTGLADVLIEAEIMGKCLKSHKKIDRHIKAMPWKIPQEKFHKVLDG